MAENVMNTSLYLNKWPFVFRKLFDRLAPRNIVIPEFGIPRSIFKIKDEILYLSLKNEYKRF